MQSPPSTVQVAPNTPITVRLQTLASSMCFNETTWGPAADPPRANVAGDETFFSSVSLVGPAADWKPIPLFFMDKASLLVHLKSSSCFGQATPQLLSCIAMLLLLLLLFSSSSAPPPLHPPSEKVNPLRLWRRCAVTT